MSERELRKYAFHKEGCRGTTFTSLIRGEPVCSCGYEELAIQPPDVAKVLQWLEEGIPKLPDEPNAEQWTKAANAIASEIRRVFHIRLTETGWEWTDE